MVTRADSGPSTFDFSEFIEADAGAGSSNWYYPAASNLWVKTDQRWGSQIAQDGLANLAKEFWPDINRAIFHNKY